MTIFRSTLMLMILSVLAACASTSNASPEFDDNENSVQEIKMDLSSYPDKDARWIGLYVDNTYPNNLKIWRDSIKVNDDKTIRYVLNVESPQGFSNISAESMLCPKRSVKIFAYGDDSLHRWIKVRNSSWRVIGTTLNQLDPARSALYKIFCEDGLPKNDQEIDERIQTRGFR